MKVQMFVLAMTQVLLGLSGCALQSSPIVGPGAAGLAASSLAVVEIPWWVESITQDDALVYDAHKYINQKVPSEVQLAPGVYAVSYSYNCHAQRPISDTAIVELHAGHTYSAGVTCCMMWTPEHECSASNLWNPRKRYATFLWFEDLTTKQVLRGSKTKAAQHD